LARLRRPSIVAVLCLLLLAGYLIVKEERHRAKGFLAAEQNALRPGRTAVPDDAARLALADRTREKVLRRLLAGFDGLGGYFLGEDDATADARQPAFVAPDTEEGRALQASKAGIYGSAGVEWSSGVSGVGIYLGQLDYAKGFPHTSEIRPDRTVDAKGKTALETAIESIVRRSPVVVFSKTTCPCVRACLGTGVADAHRTATPCEPKRSSHLSTCGLRPSSSRWIRDVRPRAASRPLG
jgi:hypothetical protein